MFEDFLSHWKRQEESGMWDSIIEKYGRAFALSWCFGFYFRRCLNMSNKEYQDFLTNVLGSRWNDFDNNDYDEILNAIKREFELLDK